MPGTRVHSPDFSSIPTSSASVWMAGRRDSAGTVDQRTYMWSLMWLGILRASQLWSCEATFRGYVDSSFGILECIWHVKIQFSSKTVVKNAPKSAKYALLLSKYHVPRYLPNEIFSQFKKSKSYFWIDVSCFAKYFILRQPGILPCVISRYGQLQHLNKIFPHVLLTGISFDFNKSMRFKKNFFSCQRFMMNKPWLLISFNNSDIFPGPNLLSKPVIPFQFLKSQWYWTNNIFFQLGHYI